MLRKNGFQIMFAAEAGVSAKRNNAPVRGMLAYTGTVP